MPNMYPHSKNDGDASYVVATTLGDVLRKDYEHFSDEYWSVGTGMPLSGITWGRGVSVDEATYPHPANRGSP